MFQLNSLWHQTTKMKRSFLLFIISLLFHTVNAQEDTTYWPSGEIRTISTYENGQRNGPWKKYQKNGQIEQEGNYVPNGKTGEWKLYYYTGELQSVSLYKDGDLVNYTYESFYKGGQVKSIAITQNGRSVHRKSYYKHGVLQYSLEYRDDGVGSRKRYYENGALKEIGTLSPLRNGVWKTYFISGELKRTEEYTNGIMTGIWKEYYQNGKIKQTEECVPKILARDFKGYYLNGQLKQIGRNDYKYSSSSGRKVGEWKEYHENGQLQKTYQYKEGYKSGVWKKFHDDGSLFQIGEYEEGKPIGFWKDYYETGQLKKIGMYSHIYSRMERKGEWKDYHENGQLKRTCYHGYRGRGGEQREYYKNGELKHIGSWGELNNQSGEWKYYRKNGKLKRVEEYYEGIVISPICTYFFNERIVVTKENYKVVYTYENSDQISKCLKYKTGKSKFYYYNGNLKTVKKYKGENRKSKIIGYYMNGSFATKEKVKKGDSIEIRKVYYQKEKQNVKWISRYINRKLKGEGKVINRLRTGEWKTYHENGKLYQIGFYKAGKLMEIKSCFDKEENELPIGTLKNGTGSVLEYDRSGVLIKLIEYENGLVKRD